MIMEFRLVFLIISLLLLHGISCTIQQEQENALIIGSGVGIGVLASALVASLVYKTSVLAKRSRKDPVTSTSLPKIQRQLQVQQNTNEKVHEPIRPENKVTINQKVSPFSPPKSPPSPLPYKEDSLVVAFVKAKESQNSQVTYPESQVTNPKSLDTDLNQRLAVTFIDSKYKISEIKPEGETPLAKADIKSRHLNVMGAIPRTAYNYRQKDTQNLLVHLLINAGARQSSKIEKHQSSKVENHQLSKIEKHQETPKHRKIPFDNTLVPRNPYRADLYAPLLTTRMRNPYFETLTNYKWPDSVRKYNAAATKHSTPTRPIGLRYPVLYPTISLANSFRHLKFAFRR